MTTTIIVNGPSSDEIKLETENHHFLRLPSSDIVSTTFKSFPQGIIQSIEINQRRRLPHAHSTSDVINIKRLSIDAIDDEITTTSNRKRSLIVTATQRSPSDIRVNLYPDVPSQIEIPTLTYKKEMPSSVPSLIGIKSSKQNRAEYLRRSLLDHRFGRRIHSSFNSSTALRSFGRRHYSKQNLSQRLTRRYSPQYLLQNSKWHFVRNHLHDIAMMNDSYARMKLIQHDLRWINLREQILKQVLDIREMSILRQQDDGILKKSQKTSFDLKTIPFNEVVHVEHDGRVYSISTRDLVLGRLIGDVDIQLDTFAQLDARRKVQVKQNLLKQQEGRNRLKKYIAFSFCLCNLSFLVLMFAAMFIFAMKTIIELKTTEFF